MRLSSVIACSVVVLVLLSSVRSVTSTPSPLTGPGATPPAPTTALSNGWTRLPNGPNAAGAQRHDDIHFVDEDHGWVVNGNGEVWRTLNGGNSWTLPALTGAYNRTVGFLDTRHGFIGLLYQLNGESLIETTDGGATWTPVVLPEPKPEGLCGMHVVDSTTICAVGAYYGSPRFVRTDDAGGTWTVTDMSPWCGALVDTYWFDEVIGLAVGSVGPAPTRRTTVLRTTDGGLTWSVRWVGTRDKELCWKISMVDDKVGYVSIENLVGTGATYYMKTRDGGLTWQERLATPNYVNCQGIGFVSEYLGWIGGWNTGTAVTVDGGDHWTGGSFGFNVNRIRFLSPSLGYAVGVDVYKYQVNPSGVGDPPTPEVTRLSRVGPNPFSARTTINYRVTQPGWVSLRVFDIQGRPVRNLVGENMNAGVFTASFEAGELAAGTYFYELRQPARTETGKMKLVP